MPTPTPSWLRSRQVPTSSSMWATPASGFQTVSRAQACSGWNDEQLSAVAWLSSCQVPTAEPDSLGELHWRPSTATTTESVCSNATTPQREDATSSTYSGEKTTRRERTPSSTTTRVDDRAEEAASCDGITTSPKS